jgi:glutaredoxin
MKKSLVCSIACLAIACGNPAPDAQKSAPAASMTSVVSNGEAVVPPFEVKGDADGLLLVWYDEQGVAHPATSRSEVPEARRAGVRVDTLEGGGERLDPAFMYVADLRTAGKDGRYAVRKVAREAFETALVATATVEKAEKAAAGGSSDVIIYGASWCGACKQAARYFSQKGVPFVEKDIEKQPGARDEMLEKAKAQGVSTGGIPVIDVKGTLLPGFNQMRIEQLLASN